MKKVTIYSDGGCEGNPGPGGWAAVLTFGERSKEISGGEPATTNNRMELTAAIHALGALKEPCEVDFYTDSEYLRAGISEWIVRWKARGWSRGKKPLKNEDLWRALDAAASRHQINWRWVKGHNGAALNERCDVLAAQEMANLRNTYPPAQLQAKLEEFQAGQDKDTQSLLFPT